MQETNVINKTDVFNSETNSVLGKLCWWHVEDCKVSRAKLMDAFETLNLPKQYLPKEIDNSRAFKRALREIEKQSNSGEKYKGIVVTKISDNEARALYSIHERHIDKASERAYIDEADTLSFNKENGVIDYGNKYADQIRELLGDCQQYYTAQNIRTIVRDLIKGWVQAISARERGAVYFVRNDQFEHLVLIDKFIKATCGGEIMDFPVYEAKRGDVWKLAASEMIQEYVELRQSSLDAMDKPNGYKCALQNRADQLGEFGKKMEMYALLLNENADAIFAQIKETQQLLLDKMKSMI